MWLLTLWGMSHSAAYTAKPYLVLEDGTIQGSEHTKWMNERSHEFEIILIPLNISRKHWTLLVNMKF